MPVRTTARHLLTAMVVLGVGCGSSGDPCQGERDEVARENCQLERVSALFEAGDPGWEAALASIAKPASRDLVRLRLAILDPQRGPTLCAGVETDDAKARCQQVVGRPHLASPPRPKVEASP
jgi:hypothetical protein